MKTLILNGAKNDKDPTNTVTDTLVDSLRKNDHEVDLMVLRNEKIAACLGCFDCWLKTPGSCIIKDAGYDLPKKVIQSDLVFLLTPVTFGMYSSELKKAFDRFPCPILMPFFKKINGEIHHAARYEKYPTLVAIGTLPNPDQESETTFKTLVERNAINIHTKAISSIIYSSETPEAIKQKIITTLSKAGAQ
jgi:multimeric flavodoxin WrbA